MTQYVFFKTAISILVFSSHNNFRLLFYKIASVCFFEKYINIIALEMAIPGNWCWASCIGMLSFLVEFSGAAV